MTLKIWAFDIFGKTFGFPLFEKNIHDSSGLTSSELMEGQTTSSSSSFRRPYLPIKRDPELILGETRGMMLRVEAHPSTHFNPHQKTETTNFPK
jgi:hypothetical protein